MKKINNTLFFKKAFVKIAVCAMVICFFSAPNVLAANRCETDDDCPNGGKCNYGVCFEPATFTASPLDNNNDYSFQVPFSGLENVDPSQGTVAIGQYIRAIYNYAIGVVGILAAIVLMFGGVLWLTAGGNPNRIENAKAWIGGSLTGLILALLSYLILYTLNPSLVNFQTMQPGTVEGYEVGCCQTENSCKAVTINEKEEGCDGDYFPNRVCHDGQCVSSRLLNCSYAVKTKSACEDKCGDEEAVINTVHSSDDYICCNCGVSDADIDGEECDHIVGGEPECRQECGSDDASITAHPDFGSWCCHCPE
jgi:hypothetical protein